MNDASDLGRGFDQALADLVGVEPMSRVVVAFSGGLDSCVLLHLLRFGASRAVEIHVAHFDHGMRAESAADAEWVRGLCRAWGLSFTIARAEAAPTSEDGARRARYDFLERVQDEEKATWLMTAHHADDQAETVFFRVLRGTGIEGLAGIPATREPGIIRPLLGFWRDDLEVYARSVGLSWREDASNAELGYARNTIRRSLLPLAETEVATGARRSLVRLAGIARENEAAWASVLPDIVAALDLEEIEGGGGGGLSWNRSAANALSEPLRARVMRHLAARSGRVLDEAGTRLAVEFITASRSGTGIELGGGLELRRELDRLVLRAGVTVSSDVPIQISEAGTGAGEALLGGTPVPVSCGGAGSGDSVDEGVFPVADLEFPLLVRGRRAGDRIRLSGGSRKVKKLLLEARIPEGRRAQTPILVDAGGRVLWVPGVARAADIEDGQGERGVGAEGWFKIQIGQP